jgi:cytochrome c-type biogenesis protein CcmE
MSVRTKLAVCGLILAGVTLYVAYLGASSSWQYYLTVDECLANVLHFTGRRLRISGQVASGSLHIREDRSGATFMLAGTTGRLPASCRGPLPDNLADNVAVVVEGSLEEDGSLRADKVLTRCASKYESQH